MGRVIKVKKGDTTYSIKLYNTEAETGTPGATTGTLKLRMDDVNYYARITQHLGSDAAGGATPLRYKSTTGNTYQVTQKGEFPIIVPASSGQTVCVSANGQTYKGANTLWFAEGTEWSAYVEADSGHMAGSLNVTGGTLNSTVTLSVTPAIAIPYGYTSYEYKSGDSTYVGNFTVPEHITVLRLSGTSQGYNVTNQTYYVRVTPGKTYSIEGHSSRYKSGSSFRHDDSIYFNGTALVVSTTERAGSTRTSMTIDWRAEINAHSTDHDFS